MQNPMTLTTIEDGILTEISGPRLMQSTREIAKWVRLSGEPDELESVRWVQKELEGCGFRTTLLSHDGYISLPGPARLEVAGENAPVGCITHSFAVSTPAEGLKAELVYVPPGVEATPAQVAGKLVLLEGYASAGSALLFDRLGAAGQIHIHDDHLHETSVSPVWGNPSDRTLGQMPTSPGISIRRADGERLKKRLQQGPLRVTLHTRVETGWRPIPLLVADLEDVPQEHFVLLSCHIDSWHYGAMDNGSANATVIEVGRLVAAHRQELKRGLRLAFWSGHSHGRYAGSAWYADHHWSDLRKHCVAHVNVDSTGGVGATVINEPPVMPQTSGLAAAVLQKLTGERIDPVRMARFADQSFYGIGLNCIYGTLSMQDAKATEGTLAVRFGGGKRSGGLGWWWHTTEDTIDKVDEALLVRDTKVYAATVFRLLAQPILPFDYREAVAELESVVADLAGSVGGRFDLAPLDEELRALSRSVAALHEKLPRAEGMDEGRRRRVNEVLVQLSRHLVPVAFHENGPFEHDMMEPLKPVPSLQPLRALAAEKPGSDAARLLATRLRRRCNWVQDEVSAASAVAEKGVRILEGD
jgi:hypothetical protein